MGYVWFLCLRMQWVMSGFCALGCNGLCLVFVPDIYMCNCVCTVLYLHPLQPWQARVLWRNLRNFKIILADSIFFIITKDKLELLVKKKTVCVLSLIRNKMLTLSLEKIIWFCKGFALKLKGTQITLHLSQAGLELTTLGFREKHLNLPSHGDVLFLINPGMLQPLQFDLF